MNIYQVLASGCLGAFLLGYNIRFASGSTDISPRGVVRLRLGETLLPSRAVASRANLVGVPRADLVSVRTESAQSPS
ncbi:hypothetical protein ISN45_Aa03g033190 [Arabidopsis thaliana x Arabidopsis arenosa]|uniref:Uncharacterized protein n=1 Tax=Arabidopsis thaliana x Arabidopsis arenosa TaxID=1240361 RepID=A0A8T2B1E2_9BRAS|nr:hypothetical protein ISN45_Aa03g033190 [Arabidopsis thaliana x Arabidopsis arenosa]